MKINLWAAGLMLALTLLTSNLTAAENVELTSDYSEADPAPKAEVSDTYAEDVGEPTTLEQVPYGACQICGSQNGCNCNNCNNGWSPPIADKCPRFGSYITMGVDSWRGVINGTSPNNNGFVTSANGAAPLPWLSEYGFGAQFGGSYGVYDVDGKTTTVAVPTAATQQVFLTTGIFRRADADLPIAFGFVHDWMLSTNLGTFGNSPTLGQWRSQVGYAMNAWNEIGIWGSWRERGASKFVPIVNGAAQPGVQTYSAIDQLDFFWHHKFGQYGGDGTFYVGIPDQHRLNQVAGNYFPAGSTGSLGTFIVGTNWLVPISDRISMYANGMYMKPSAHAGTSPGPVGSTGSAFASAQDFWNVAFGFVFYPDHAARSSTVAGRKWMPYMPVANNSSFMIDTNVTQ